MISPATGSQLTGLLDGMIWPWDVTHGIPRQCIRTKWRSTESAGWLIMLTYPSETYESQLGWVSPTHGKKIKVMFQSPPTSNMLCVVTIWACSESVWPPVKLKPVVHVIGHEHINFTMASYVFLKIWLQTIAVFPLAYPPVIQHRRLENGPFISVFPVITSIHKGFSIAVFDYQRVYPIEIHEKPSCSRFSHGFPMVFPWFSHAFPLISCSKSPTKDRTIVARWWSHQRLQWKRWSSPDGENPWRKASCMEQQNFGKTTHDVDLMGYIYIYSDL